MRPLGLLAALLLGIALAPTVWAADPSEIQDRNLPEYVFSEPEPERRWTPEDVRAAQRSSSPVVAWIIETEVGGVGHDPYAVGRAGELGCAQLHPRGLLDEYLRWSGGADPMDCYTAARFVEHTVAQGRGCNWTAYKWRYC